MIITRHTELCEFLFARMDEVAFLKDQLRKKEIIHALDQNSLKTFFDYNLTLGLFVQGGSYDVEQSTRAQIEKVEVIAAIGATNLASPPAPLGAGDDPGCWDVLEAIRNLFSGENWKTELANIRKIEPRRWRSLLVISGLAVIGIELQVELWRPLPDKRGLEIYGAGYPANQ